MGALVAEYVNVVFGFLARRLTLGRNLVYPMTWVWEPGIVMKLVFFSQKKKDSQSLNLFEMMSTPKN